MVQVSSSVIYSSSLGKKWMLSLYTHTHTRGENDVCSGWDPTHYTLLWANTASENVIGNSIIIFYVALSYNLNVIATDSMDTPLIIYLNFISFTRPDTWRLTYRTESYHIITVETGHVKMTIKNYIPRILSHGIYPFFRTSLLTITIPPPEDCSQH